MSGKTIIYVEDNELNRKIVRDLRRRTTYRLIEATDGETGIALALEQRPDLVLEEGEKLTGARRAQRQSRYVA